MSAHTRPRRGSLESVAAAMKEAVTTELQLEGYEYVRPEHDRSGNVIGHRWRGPAGDILVGLTLDVAPEEPR